MHNFDLIKGTSTPSVQVDLNLLLQIKRVMNSGETLQPEFDLHDGDLCETAPICGF